MVHRRGAPPKGHTRRALKKKHTREELTIFSEFTGTTAWALPTLAKGDSRGGLRREYFRIFLHKILFEKFQKQAVSPAAARPEPEPSPPPPPSPIEQVVSKTSTGASSTTSSFRLDPIYVKIAPIVSLVVVGGVILWLWSGSNNARC